MMTSKEIGGVLAQVASLLELNGENAFKVRAYESASRLLLSRDSSGEELLQELETSKLPGIGAGMKGAIQEIIQTGEYGLLTELQQSFPEGLQELMNLSGLGPKKLKLVVDQLEIKSLETFIEACEQDRLLEVKGFSEKSQAKLLAGAIALQGQRGKMLLSDAWTAAGTATEKLLRLGAKRAEVAGEVKRYLPVSSSVVICVEADPALHGELAKSAKKISPSIELLFSPEREFDFYSWYNTGSSKHIEELAAYAKASGFHLSEGGLSKDSKTVEVNSENALYAALNLPFIPPELREGTGEVEAARVLRASGKQEFDLVEEADLKGIIHVHSTYSDGKNSLRELVEEAIRRGYSYLGLTDHSQSAAYARGLKVAAIRKQRAEVISLRAEFAPFVIFHGIESDILADGSLDYPDDVLDEFDFIVASVHSRFSMDEAAMTERIIRAVQNPYTTILGHSSGRKLLQRDGYGLDTEAVLDAAAETGTAVEINSNPKRLDLDWSYLPAARERGILTPISPDAHSLPEFGDVRWGVHMAKKGGLEPKSILNCMDADAFSAFCGELKSSKLKVSGREQQKPKSKR